MSVSSLLEHPGLRGLVIGNAEGELIGEIGTLTGVEGTAAIAAVLAEQFGNAGEALGLGVFVSAMVKAPNCARVLAEQEDAIALLDLKPDHPTAEIEALLRESDWASRLREGIADLSDEAASIDSDADELLEPHDSAPLGPNRLQPTLPEPTEVALGTPDDGSYRLPEESVTPPFQSSENHPVPSDAPILDGSWDIEQVLTPLSDPVVDLRRALVRGDLAAAKTIGANLFEPSGDGTLSAQRAADREALGNLLDGISAALLGDGRSACARWRALVPAPSIDPSVLWAREIWLARTQCTTGLSIEDARVDADIALEFASVLDPDARAVSLLVEAEVALLGGRPEDAVSLLNAARDLFVMSGDTENMARAWLLEARAWASLQRDEDSLVAAHNARAQEPSWPAPLAFLASRALAVGQVDDARAMVQPLLTQTPLSPDIERVVAVLDMVRDGELTEEEAAEFLRAVEQPPDGLGVATIEQLVARLPHRPVVREALAGMLLRMGEYDHAEEEFGSLFGHPGLTAEQRSSVSCALEYLTVERARRESTPTESSRSSSSQPVRHSSTPAAQFELGILARSRASGKIPLRPAAVSGVPVDASFSGSMLSGSLRQFCLADVLEYLRNTERTGTLVCASEFGVGELHVRSGRLVRGSSPNTQSVVDWLVQNGALSRIQLDHVTHQSPVAAEAAGSATMLTSLLQEGLVSPELVREGLRSQVDTAVRELMSWSDGQFAFDSDAVTDFSLPEVELAIDPMELLLEIAKQLDKLVC